MRTHFHRMRHTLCLLQASRKHLVLAATAAVAMAAVTFYVPVILTPGNTVTYQLSLMTWYNAALIGLFSLLFGLSFATYVYAAEVAGGVLSLVRGGGGSGVAGFTGALFSSPVCVSCLSTILAAIGLGGSAITIFQYRTPIQVVGIAMLLGSFYAAAYKLEAHAADGMGG